MPTNGSLTGADKAAILILALGKESGSSVLELLDDDTIRILTSRMSSIGTVPSQDVETVIGGFIEAMASNSIHGDHEIARQLLEAALPDQRVGAILSELGSPSGPSIWHRLTGVREDLLAGHLLNEHPQTVAVVLSKLKPAQAAKILDRFDDELAINIIERMLITENISKQALEDLEESLRINFMTTLSQGARRPAHEQIAEILNALDAPSEERVMRLLRERNEFEADRIRKAMFTFDDIAGLDQASAMVVMRAIDKSVLAKALKGATARTRDFFTGLMSLRAAKIFADEMQNLGPLRLKEVDEARQRIIAIVRELEQRGDIVITRGEDEIVLV